MTGIRLLIRIVFAPAILAFGFWLGERWGNGWFGLIVGAVTILAIYVRPPCPLCGIQDRNPACPKCGRGA